MRSKGRIRPCAYSASLLDRGIGGFLYAGTGYLLYSVIARLLFLDLCGVFHRDAALQGLGNGAAALEHSDRALSFLALALGNLNVVFGAEMRELQDTFGGVDGAFCFRPELVGVTGYPTRFQRAGEGAGESAGGGGDEIVEGRGQLLFGGHLVEVGDFRVHPEKDWVLEAGDVGAALGAFLLDDFDLGNVHGIAHRLGLRTMRLPRGYAPRNDSQSVIASPEGAWRSAKRCERSEAISSRPKGVATAFGLATTPSASLRPCGPRNDKSDLLCLIIPASQ